MLVMVAASEIELLLAWRAGNRAAGDALTRAYYARVFGFFRLRVPEVAEDLTQKTFLACTEARERCEPETFAGFLFGIARRQLYRYLERSRLEDALHFRSVGPQSVLSPSVVVATHEEHTLLLRALEALSLEHQTVLGFYYVQGLKAREIAESLATPVSTVTSKISRARDELRVEIASMPAPPATRESLTQRLETWFQTLAALANDGGAGSSTS